MIFELCPPKKSNYLATELAARTLTLIFKRKGEGGGRSSSIYGGRYLKLSGAGGEESNSNMAEQKALF